MRHLLRVSLPVLVVGVAATLPAQEIPLRSWTVPPNIRPSSGLSTMTDLSPGVGFVAISPCRLVDTRQAGFPAGYGPPSLAGGGPRNFDLNSDPLCTGIPAETEAYSLNVTVTNTQGPGFILIYPQGGTQPTVSTLNYVANETVANAAIVPAGTNGGVTVIAGVSGTNLIIDINGYFTDGYEGGTQFVAVVTLGAGAAILGVNPSGVPGSHGVGGFAGGANAVHGVQGQVSTSGLGGSSGVHGINDSTAQRTYGVLGETASTSPHVAGVFGRDGTGTVNTTVGAFSSAGVRGESKSLGVVGISEGIAVLGGIVNAAGGNVVSGFLGDASGPYGIKSNGNAQVNGNLSVSGTISAAMKPFVQPHPFDPSKEIRYVSLEGPHSEVYFRGSAQVSQGVTRIPIPEHFGLVAIPGSYSTLVTPVGAMATIAVLSEDVDGIVIRASRDVKVHYVVYAERDAMRNPEPIIENVDFRPDETGDLVARLPESYRRLMIRNGTLNPDGTVNADTVRRMGWDKAWEAKPADR